MEFKLPYGIRVVVAEPIIDRLRVQRDPGSVSSELSEHVGRSDTPPEMQHRTQGRVEALETLLLALACSGVNIGSKDFVRALEETVRTLAGNTAPAAGGSLRLQGGGAQADR